MDLKPEARHQALLATVEALYARLQSGTLTSDDVIDLNSLTATDNSSFLDRLFADRALFEAHYGDFKKSYEIFRIFGEGETVLDVGAHWGYSALAMRYQGCGARIVSIEAMPFHLPPLARLKKLAAGKYDYVHVAATDVPQRLTFYVPVVNRKILGGLSSTGGTLVPRHAKTIARRAGELPSPLSPGAAEEVKLAVLEVGGLPIDDIMDAFPESERQVVAIKMDIEGHEPAALKGARRLIMARRPVLMIEGGTESTVAILREYGYIRAARVAGQLVPWNGHPPDSDTFWYHPDTAEDLHRRGLVQQSFG